MPAALTSKEEIISRLFIAFRDRGFEGASIADLSQATGLGKSSLYHYFPNGKEEMAEAVLQRAEESLHTTVLDVAKGDEPLRVRVRKVLRAIEQTYSGGRTPCVLGQLANAEIGAAARRHLRLSFETWIEAIAILAKDAGYTRSRARNFSEDWVAQVQGALLLHGATGNLLPFQRAMAALLRLARD